MPQKWYVRRGEGNPPESAGSQTVTGPLSPGEVRFWALQGRLHPEDEVSLDREKWMLAAHLAGLEFRQLEHTQASAPLIGQQGDPLSEIDWDVPSEPLATVLTPDNQSGDPSPVQEHHRVVLEAGSSSAESEFQSPGSSEKQPSEKQLNAQLVLAKGDSQSPTDKRTDPVLLDIVGVLKAPHGVIPGYEVLGVLGRGAMGVVYRARQNTLQRVVAIKTLLVHFLSSEEALARFQQEARTVALLQHPHIVTAHDFGESEFTDLDSGRTTRRLYLVMELLRGETVDAFLKREGRLSEVVAWGIARQTAAALAHAAEQGVVHRDIKPANLFLIDPPQGTSFPGCQRLVKVTDFGISRLVDLAQTTDVRLTAERTIIGTPTYMAPEQAWSSEVGPPADIYALGATVYHMLSGEAPFQGSSVRELMMKKASQSPPPLYPRIAGVSADSDELLERMLQPDSTRRIGDLGELLGRIDSLLIARGVLTDSGSHPAENGLESKPTAVAAGSRESLPAGIASSRHSAAASAASLARPSSPAETDSAQSLSPEPRAPHDQTIPAAGPQDGSPAEIDPQSAPADQSSVISSGQVSSGQVSSGFWGQAGRGGQGGVLGGWLIGLGWTFVVVVVATTALFGWLWLMGDQVTFEKPPAVIANGAGAALYDGRTIEGWVTLDGFCKTVTDTDGVCYLTGHGQFARPLPLSAPATGDYRVTLEILSQGKDPVLILFGLRDPSRSRPAASLGLGQGKNAAAGSALGSRALSGYAIEIAGDDARLGWSPNGQDFGPPWGPMFTIRAWPEGSREVRFERIGQRWWAYFDGQLLGSVPATRAEELAEFRISSPTGRAWFNTIMLTELEQ